MAINITCKCGKQFRAKDEYAGRRGLCPACKREFLIPTAISINPMPSASNDTATALPTAESDTASVAEQAKPSQTAWKKRVMSGAAIICALIAGAFIGHAASPSKVCAQHRPRGQIYRRGRLPVLAS